MRELALPRRPYWKTLPSATRRVDEHATNIDRDDTTRTSAVVFTSASLDAVRQLATRALEDFAPVRKTAIDGSRPQGETT
jgi:hypothetical protein